MSVRRLVETVFRYGACVPVVEAEPSAVDGWFRDEPRGRKALDLQRKYAREACAGCPVRAECLVIALSHEQETGMSWGIWGGICASDRASALRHARESAQDPAVRVEEIASHLVTGQWETSTKGQGEDTVDDSLVAS